MLPDKRKITMKKKIAKPRLPIDAVLKLRSLPFSTKKGKKGYDRIRVKQEAAKSIEEKIESF